MLPGKPQHFIALFRFLATGMVLSFLASCGIVVPKNYPENKPFVYETNIHLEGNFSKDEKSTLESQLKSQLHDSIRVRTVGKVVWEVLKNPPVYDSVHADASVKYMRALLHSVGYFRDSIGYDTSMKVKNTRPPQQRTTVDFHVVPGKLFRLDSISFNMAHSELQALTIDAQNKTLLKKGEAFSKYTVSAEIDRLVELYRNNGYLRFSRDELIGYWDTLDVSLLRPTIDPFEQILILERLQQRRENPTANIEMRLKPGFDSSRLRKYYVGNTTIYPDFSEDTSGIISTKVNVKEGVDVVYFRNMFKPKFLAQNLYFEKGELYRQERFIKTINRFNLIGTWRLVNIEQNPRPGTDTVDFDVILVPADKYSFAANIEGSRNSGLLLSEGTLLGIGFNTTLANRNFGRSGNLSTTSFRYGTELGVDSQFVETRQVSLSHSIFFPRMIPNMKFIPARIKENATTVFSLAVGNTERRRFFNLTSINASWGYNFSWKNRTLSLKLPNIEYAYLNPRPQLENLFSVSPVYRFVFNTGFVFSMQAGYQVRTAKKNYSQIIRLNFEESGLLTNYIKIKSFDSLYRFVKFDAEYIRSIQLGKKELVLRTFTGIGIALKTRTRVDSVNLPFFKQYYAGGPNSMRGWGLRLLGPGSTLKYRTEAPLRFGDFQFETNAELRFPLTKIAGFRTDGAIFTDIGNVWFIRKTNSFPDGHLSSVSKFFKDLAVNTGAGVRINFGFLIIRLDYGLKIKNPSPEPINAAGQNKWFHDFNPLGGILQLGINYPFRF